MKVIFLDIDGVLNVISQGRDDFGSIFHPHLIENLKTITDQTGAKIVISSSWRSNGLTGFQEMWKHRNYPGEIIGLTPYLRFERSFQQMPRGCEIKEWLEEHHGLIESYVIIDDDIDMLLEQKDNFVKCSENRTHDDCVDIGYGLTKICAEKAIEILNKK
jgi:hypothetical protein